MFSHHRQPPRFVPTLTEVIDPEQVRQAASMPKVAQSQSQPMDQPPQDAAPAFVSKPVDGFDTFALPTQQVQVALTERAITQRVLETLEGQWLSGPAASLPADVQEKVNAIVQDQVQKLSLALSQQLAPVMQAAARELLKQELHRLQQEDAGT
ncbi:MAG: hypothetical protein ACI4QS_10235 [Comamonas sp.]